MTGEQTFCSGPSAPFEGAISQRISTLIKTDDWVVVHRGHELYDAEDMDRLEAEGDITDLENPVLREAKARGDFAYFASQLRRGLGRWNQADIDTALPVIDRLAREEES